MSNRRSWFWLFLLVLLALALRLLVWHWRYFYPLGGDEQEYLNQALTLLRERRYVELRLMRPPLYPLLLASWIVLVDSLVERLRLVQALISALTVIPVFLFTRALSGRNGPGLLAAALTALSYTLAANATELLTETVFLSGLAVLLWLLLQAGLALQRQQQAWGWAIAAGLVLAGLCLVRSVALPLLVLGAGWLLLAGGWRWSWRGAVLACVYGLAALLLILPWSVRNYYTYGAVILIDTTGAENLWLDNEPLGREYAKAQLYALGEDRARRQELATQRGIAAIRENPAGFLAKAWGELLKLGALEYTDDLRARPVIYVPPLEVWARLLLGDGIWLILLFGGLFGLALQARDRRFGIDPRWLLLPWLLYVALTTLIFHVELRYRLPLYPVLLAYTATLLPGPPTTEARPARLRGRLLALLLSGAAAALLLAHQPYPRLAWQLGWKHLQLARAEQALNQGLAQPAHEAAEAALRFDPESVQARVLLARALLLQNDREGAQQTLDDALRRLPEHAQARVLRGAVLRANGQNEAARADLAYETASLQDLQAWAWHAFPASAPGQLDIGGGLDLGYLRGFHAPEPANYRWTSGEAQLLLAAPRGLSVLQLRLAAGTFPQAATQVEVLVDGMRLGQIQLSRDWRIYELPLERSAPGNLLITLRSAPWRPRDFDRSSPDGRQLGVMLDSVALTAE